LSRGDTEILKRKEPQKKLKRISKNPLTSTQTSVIIQIQRTKKAERHTQRKVVDTMTKMTYVNALDVAIVAVADNAEVAEKLTALRAQIAKKNTAERKPTKTQVANDALKGQIVDALDEGVTASEVAEKFGISNQKASALLTALVKDGLVERYVEKRKAYFKAVA
jgi:DNA-binding transcriptional ArsR family regulator